MKGQPGVIRLLRWQGPTEGPFQFLGSETKSKIVDGEKLWISLKKSLSSYYNSSEQ